LFSFVNFCTWLIFWSGLTSLNWLSMTTRIHLLMFLVEFTAGRGWIYCKRGYRRLNNSKTMCYNIITGYHSNYDFSNYDCRAQKYHPVCYTAVNYWKTNQLCNPGCTISGTTYISDIFYLHRNYSNNLFIILLNVIN